jgi:PPK2 family polyphosphate:nucleotide phosphotransferase
VLDTFVVPPGQPAELDRRDPGARYGESKVLATARLTELIARLQVLQNRLWAEKQRSVLLVLQGMDASGKDGTIRRVFTGLNPQGCRVVSFRPPNEVEREHDFLWRIHRSIPRDGEIGIFNRSHYEDIVTAAVIGVIDDDRARRRARDVRKFERILDDEGTAIVKVFLHLSKDEQRRRLRARLADPEKRWKFRPDDLEARERWDEYMARYDEAITATSTPWAPWYVVPADHKWVSGLAVAELLVQTLERLDPQPPPQAPDLDGLVVE